MLVGRSWSSLGLVQVSDDDDQMSNYGGTELPDLAALGESDCDDCEYSDALTELPDPAALAESEAFG